jgi:hypothetical protein
MERSDREKAATLRVRIGNLKSDLKEAELELQNVQKGCKHEWRKPMYLPDEDLDNDDSEYPRWQRVCNVCGKAEWTDKWTTETIKVPNFEVDG